MSVDCYLHNRLSMFLYICMCANVYVCVIPVEMIVFSYVFLHARQCLTHGLSGRVINDTTRCVTVCMTMMTHCECV